MSKTIETLSKIHDEADHAIEREPESKYDEVAVLYTNMRAIREMAKDEIERLNSENKNGKYPSSRG